MSTASEIEYRRAKAIQWMKLNFMSKIDNAGIECTERMTCGCPICKLYGEMREKAIRNHDEHGMDWPLAWRMAGWGGSGATPFSEPGPKMVQPPRDWMEDRFSDLL